MALTDLMLIQNKKNPKIEEYVTVEQWERDFIPLKLDMKFNILNRNVKDLKSNTTTVKVTDFIQMKKDVFIKEPINAFKESETPIEQGKEPPAAMDIKKEKPIQFNKPKQKKQ